MALSSGNEPAASKLFLKARRAYHIAHRNKSDMDAHRKTAHADRAPTHLHAIPKGKGVDPEDRKLRLKKLFDKARQLGKTAKQAEKGGDPTLGSRLQFKAKYHADVATAYQKGGHAKRKWQNVWRDQDRITHHKVNQAIKGSTPMDPKKAAEWEDKKLGWSAGHIATQWKPFIKKSSKVTVADRSKRLAKILRKSDQIRDVKNAWYRNVDLPGGVSGVSKRLSRDGSLKTAFDHGLDLQRSHAIIAKFLKKPGHREKLNQAIRHLRKGLATTGRTKDWRKIAHPLKKFGIKSENKQ